ncbi:MAG: aminoacyl-tRNA hydrolase [Cytophagaceae bacterium]|nr:aminoacyl-tRNA hydrolase [Cytophagaceae bacterium]MDW8456362.1 aminoacyl-tRNA hydrolase [Cytophagaceae bacterium]
MKYLICGLGNIGEEYKNTRHNIGFMAADLLAQKLQCSFVMDKLAYVCESKYKGKHIICIKPTTYMNLSGKAVRYWLFQKNISIENLLVLTDDISLEFGRLRLRPKGSSGGHNGLASINEALGTEAFPRLRIGIGSNFSKGRQVEYVLGNFTDEETPKLPQILEQSVEAILSFITIGIERTMNTFNK